MDRKAKLAALTDEQKQELLREARLRRLTANTMRTLLPRVERTARMRPSLTQERLWFLHRLDPSSAAYVIPAALTVRGRLDVDAFRRAFASLVHRHEALRTTFGEHDGLPYQRVEAEMRVPIEVEPIAPDLVGARLREIIETPFDLAVRPLSVRLFSLGPDWHVFVLAVHHIVFDGWSSAVLVRELVASYLAELAGAPPSLPTVATQFVDYADWSRQPEREARSNEDVAFFAERLRGVPALEMPTDRPRSASPSGRGTTARSTIDKDLRSRIGSLAAAHGATPFVVLLAAYAALLSKHTAQSDFAVGTPLANRASPDVEGTIGPFVTTVAVRTRVQASDTFEQLIERTRSEFLEVVSHANAPFEKVVDALGVERTMDRTPVFQTMFALHPPSPLQALTFDELTVELLDYDWGTAPFEITLNATERASGELDIRLTTADDIFDPPFAERLLERYVRCLRAAVLEPAKPLDVLALAAPEEVARDLEALRGPVIDVANVGLHSAIEANAEQRPDRPAIADGARSLTYGELCDGAEGVADALRAHGVGPGDLVGVYVERSVEMVVGLLGVLKTGAAYVPLDPAYPASRISYMLEDSGAKAVVVAGARPPSWDRALVDVSAVPPTRRRVSPVPSPSAPAYVIYTSGSTGRPKGVCIPHGAAVSFLAGMDPILGDVEDGVWLAVTSMSFDISVLETWGALGRGMRVRLGDARVERRQSARGSTPKLSVFFFGSYNTSAVDAYDLVLDAARLADERGFEAVYTPERHFNEFGGYFPNPSVLGAAIAATTRRIGIRAGSVVSPLHHEVRIAEEWSVVDAISRGRVGISFASGWHAHDFVFAPERYADRAAHMRRQIETVRRLWRGESVTLPSGAGEVSIRTLPRPVQKELPTWVTAAGNLATFKLAGELGAGVLTHLLGQTWDELRAKIAEYRAAWKAAGHAGEGSVVLMLHTYVGESEEEVRDVVRTPFVEYLKTSAGLMRSLAESLGVDLNGMTKDDVTAVIEASFERYVGRAGLMGTAASVRAIIDQASRVGIDELGCLIDFGVDRERVMRSLARLADLGDELRRESLRGELDIRTILASEPISHLQCTPTLARALIEENADTRALRRFLVGGEALDAKLKAELVERVGAGNVTNMYGPTETTVWSMAWTPAGPDGAVSLGGSLPNQHVYVLDRALTPVPRGVVGELYIGGAGVALGYHRRADLTADRFVPDIAGEPGARMYRTGDLVRLTADGTVEYVGRADTQVKLRGHRIELGEIEDALREIAGVASAFAQVHTVGGVAVLVAHLLVSKGASLSLEEMQRRLGDRLPAYMVPQRIIVHETLPLLPNGKVDRKRLPAPTATAESYVAPSGEVEEAIAETWQELLGAPRVGRGDDFFALGGHSLSAMQAASRLRRKLSVDVDLKWLFQAPKLADFARRVSEAMAGGAEAGAPSRSLAVPRVERRERMDLSETQERLWFLYKLDPTNSAYVASDALLLEGAVDVRALQRAFDALVERHEALRTTFGDDDGRPYQTVQAARGIELEIEPLAPERLAEALRLVSRARFDLPQGALRLRLFQLREDRYVLVVTMHHIATDGWSLSVLVRDLIALYRAQRSGAAAALAPIAAQFVDYVAWSRRPEREATVRAHVQASAERLRGVPILDLPTDRPRTPSPTGRGTTAQRRVPKALRERVGAYASERGTTAFVVLLAAYAAVIGKHARQSDFAIGTPLANRTTQEVEGTIGPFVSTSVARVRPAPRSSFDDLVAATRKEFIEVLAQAEAPFERLVDALGLERTTDRTPVFQTMFVLHPPTPLQTLTVDGAKIELVDFDWGLAPFEVTVHAFEQTTGDLDIRLTTADDLYAGELSDVLLERYVYFLDQALAAPQTCLEQLALEPFEKVSRQLDLMRGTTLDVAARMLHEPLEDVAERTPDRVALQCVGTSLTYRELCDWAEGVADALRALGLGPMDVVAVYADRSIELVVGLLGVLKSGAAYVPLDPAYPEARLEYMLEDSGCRAVVVAGMEWSSTARPVLDVRKIGRSTHRRSTPAPLSLAYVIYTSGSTGKPKGVAVPHASAASYLAGVPEMLGDVDGEEVWLAVTSMSFDPSVLELWGALGRGMKVVIGDVRATASDGAAAELDVRTLLAREKNAYLQCTPTLARALVEENASFGGLRRIFVGGEALDSKLKASLLARVGMGKLTNLYGPTETTVWSTGWSPMDDVGGVSLGSVFANVHMALLDEAQMLVPRGIIGELYIGGGGVTYGYHGKSELTAERFVPDPRGGPGARMYRTGDLARFTFDGRLEYVGRADAQVKLRGHRIELGEIEEVMRVRPGIASAHVKVHDIGGHAMLVGHVVASKGASIDLEELQHWLGQRLPAYMVPQRILLHEELPLLPNGKVDRKRLPDPATTSEDYAAPEGPIEEAIAAVWTELLRAPRIGRSDDFFALGGHSLFAMQAASRLRRKLSLEVDLKWLFQAPKLVDFARLVSGAAPTWSEAELVRRGLDRGPLAAPQERLLLLERVTGAPGTLSHTVAYRLRGALDVAAFEASLRDIQARHQACRIVLTEDEDGELVQCALGPEVIAERTPLVVRPLEAKELGAALDLERRLPFDLTERMMRCSLLRIASEEHVFVVTTHHLTMDAWSLAIFVRELVLGYAARRDGRKVELPPIELEYIDYAQWTRELRTPEREQALLAFWRGKLAGDLPSLGLVRPTTAGADVEPRELRVVLDRPRVEALRKAARQSSVTLASLTLAALKVVLARAEGQREVLVESIFANRESARLERVAGLMMVSLLVRTSLEGDPSFGAFSARVQAAWAEAVSFKDIPFETLVSELRRTGILAREQIAQVLFNYINDPREALTLTDLVVEPIESTLPATAHDLTVTCVDLADGSMRLSFEFDAAQIPDENVERIARWLTHLLEAVAKPGGAERRLSELEIVRASELACVRARTGGVVDDIVDRIGARVKATPDAVAVEDAERSLTYAELWSASSVIADDLVARGAGPDDVVGVRLERGVSLYVSLLGVLMAGAAYTVIDLELPEAEASARVRELGIRITIDGEQGLTSREITTLEHARRGPRAYAASSLAYLVFTSGSTGRARAVGVSRASMSAFVDQAIGAFALERDDRVLQFASLSWDTSIEEIFPALAVGATVVARRPEMLEARAFLALASAMRITVVDLPTAFFGQLLEAEHPPEWEGLRTVIIGGEAANAGQLARWRARSSGRARLLNTYGATEATAVTTALDLAGVGGGPVPIGRVFGPRTATYVLDEDGRPVGIGMVGELWVGGAGVARGYIGNPATTAQRFRPDPFSTDTGARMYATGDLVRVGGDDVLEYVGRRDRMLKVRGHRVEPAEVEARLLALGSVAEAAAVVREVDELHTLLGYVVLRPGSHAEPDAMRAELLKLAPYHLVVDRIVVVDALPRLPNGKIDKRLLPLPAAVSREFVHPATAIEQVIADAWAEVLGIDSVGRFDDFFALGGHSLAALRVVSRLERDLGCTIPLRALFESATVAAFAAALVAIDPSLADDVSAVEQGSEAQGAQ